MEGTLGGVVSMLIAGGGLWWALEMSVNGGLEGGWTATSRDWPVTELNLSLWMQLAVICSVLGVLEAVTTQIDNLFLPLVGFALFCCLQQDCLVVRRAVRT